MAINYTEKGEGLHRAVAAAGHFLECRDGVWRSSNDVAVQAIIDSYDPLPNLKAAKVAAVKAEGLRRIQTVFGAIKDFDILELEAERWQSLRSTAKQTTPKYQSAIDIYTAGRNAVTTVNGFTTAAQVNAYDPVTGPGWPP